MSLKDTLPEVDIAEIKSGQYLTVKQFAEKEHLTSQAVLGRIRKNKISGCRIDGRIFVKTS